MKTKLINWLLKQLQPKFTKEQKQRINEFKSLFRIHFEGYDEADIPNEPIRIISFGITNLDYKFTENKLEITITLERPGLIIGKAGRTIDSLNEYMGKFNNHISLKQSHLWRLEK